MTTIEPPTGDAEAEAERRWPDGEHMGNAADKHKASAFVAGAAWQDQQTFQIVATVNELDTLPIGSVVQRGREVWIKRQVPPDGWGIEVGWYLTGADGYVLRPPLPATVLDTPKETS